MSGLSHGLSFDDLGGKGQIVFKYKNSPFTAFHHSIPSAVFIAVYHLFRQAHMTLDNKYV